MLSLLFLVIILWTASLQKHLCYIINTVNSNISKMDTHFQEFQNNITTVCKDVKLAAEMAESARAMATKNANELTLLRAEVDELKKQSKEFTTVQEEVHVLKTEYRKLRDENIILKSQTNNIESLRVRAAVIILLSMVLLNPKINLLHSVKNSETIVCDSSKSY